MTSEGVKMALKKIEVKVRKEFEIPDKRIIDDPIFAEKVLTNGVVVTMKKEELEARHVVDETIEKMICKQEKILNQFKEENESLRQQLDDMRNTASAVFESGRSVGKTELQLYQDQVNMLRKDREELIMSFSQKTQELVDTLIRQKEGSVEKGLEKIMSDVKWLGNALGKGGLGSTVTNVEIGNAGERFVENILEQSFIDCPIIYVGNSPNSGDFIFEFKGAKYLIEVKNKCRIDQSDLIKFEKDVSKHAETHEIVAGIFINLQNTTLIRGRSRVYFDIDRLTVPTLYLGGILETPYVIRIAIWLLHQVIKSGKLDRTSSDSDCDEKKNKQTAECLLVKMSKDQFYIDRDRKNIQGLLDGIEERQKDLCDLTAYKNELLQLFPDLQQTASRMLESQIPVSVGGQRCEIRPHHKLSEAQLVDFIVKNLKENIKVNAEDLYNEFKGLTRFVLSNRFKGIKYLLKLAETKLIQETAIENQEQDIQNEISGLLKDEDTLSDKSSNSTNSNKTVLSPEMKKQLDKETMIFLGREDEIDD